MNRKPSLIIDDYTRCLKKCNECDRPALERGIGGLIIGGLTIGGLKWNVSPCTACPTNDEKNALKREWTYNPNWLILKAKERLR